MIFIEFNYYKIQESKHLIMWLLVWQVNILTTQLQSLDLWINHDSCFDDFKHLLNSLNFHYI